jgi:hypothetical protein
LRKKEPCRCRKLTDHQIIRTKKRKNPRHIIIKTLSTQNKERILKATEEKRQVTYKDKPVRITADFSTQTLNERGSWKNSNGQKTHEKMLTISGLKGNAIQNHTKIPPHPC